MNRAVATHAARFGGLRIVDVSEPTHPLQVGGYDTSGEARQVAVVGDASSATPPAGFT